MAGGAHSTAVISPLHSNVLQDRMQFWKIWLLCVAAAVFYGIVHDQVTARVCVEYFTIGDPPIFGTHSPTLLALDWGVIATRWMGAFLGFWVASSARLGRWQRLDANQLVRPVLVLLGIMAISALIAGVIGYTKARHGEIQLGFYEALLDKSTQQRFIADWWAHQASYAVGFLGGLAVCLWVLHIRRSVSLNRTPSQDA
jgi:hypothetical protein